MCAACFARHGGSKGIHKDCAEGARRSQEKYDAVERDLAAGESFVIAAWGDWHETVPEGMTGVLFKGRAGEVARLVPAGDYEPGPRPRLADYPGAVPWDGPDARKVATAA